jgi:hypothetical protein
MIPGEKKSNRPDEALVRLAANGNAAAARLSGHTVGTSKSQLHKARASLKAVLAKRSLGGRARYAA